MRGRVGINNVAAFCIIPYLTKLNKLAIVKLLAHKKISTIKFTAGIEVLFCARTPP